MSQFTEKKLREWHLLFDSEVEFGWICRGPVEPSHSKQEVVPVIEKSAYDRMKLALEKALEQRNKAVEAAVRLITGNDLKQEMDTDFYKEIGIGLTELDAEIQKILEGKE